MKKAARTKLPPQPVTPDSMAAVRGQLGIELPTGEQGPAWDPWGSPVLTGDRDPLGAPLPFGSVTALKL
jgi:hypothetical protein